MTHTPHSVKAPLTADDKARFIEALERHRSVLHACKSAGVGRRTVYSHRESDPEFAAEWDETLKRNGEELHQSAFNRALFGWKEPVYGAGGFIGYKRKYSDALTIFMLKLAGYIPKDETADAAKDVLSDLATIVAADRKRKGRKPA